MDAKVKTKEDLIDMALATNAKGATLILQGLGKRLKDELIQIAAAGGGNVIFA